MERTNGLRSYRREESVVFRKTNEEFGGLSNMAPGFPLRLGGTQILTSEALYQACRFPHDLGIQRLIIGERSPMTAKMKSKPHRSRSRPDWDDVRVEVMRWCLRVKLAQNWRDFAELLLATGERPIVEESRKDPFWGARSTPDDEQVLVGKNVLGRLLMELRDELKAKGEELKRVEPLMIPDFLLLGEQIPPVWAQAASDPGESGLVLLRETDSDAQGPMGTPRVESVPRAAHLASSMHATSRGQSTSEAKVTYRKKLIEVALPLEAINRESAREKSIRHGHPSTLHLWWARRPLAACRAVLFASIVDDPSSRPEEFPTEEEQESERQRLFRIIEELVKWENSTNETVLEAARAEIMKATDGNPPPVLDPFCGGGAIPLEAQRLGLEARASDLNPVAVLITKALVEIPPKFAAKPSVNPESQKKLAHGATWSGAQGLAEDVQYYGRWMRDEAFKRIGHLYPKVTLPDGRNATAIAWLWARTVRCPNPACGSTAPLLNSVTLARRRGSTLFLRPEVNKGVVSFDVTEEGVPPVDRTVHRTGASCLACGGPIPLEQVREEGKRHGLGEQLLCIVGEGTRRRIYLTADSVHAAAARVSQPADVPEIDLPHNPRAVTTPNYGMKQHWQLFSNRQLVALTTLSDLVAEARGRVVGAANDPAYGDAVATYLALALGRFVNRCSRLCIWNPTGEKIEQVMARTALPMIWMYAESNPFSDSTGNFFGQLEYLVEALRRTPARGLGAVAQADAAEVTSLGTALVITDPPYYDNVPYSDLSDFFYVWLRRSIGWIDPTLFGTVVTPKAKELIAEPAREGTWLAAADFFESGLRKVFERISDIQDRAIPFGLFYALKQAEDAAGNGRSSTGWEKMLEALLASGWAISGTWPLRTERAGGLRELGRNSLASSIFLVCRPRAVAAGLAARRDFVAALRAELPMALKQLQHGSIAPVDLAQAAIGPGMAIFSRYTKVVEADGSPMAVRTALGLINEALDEILAEQEGDFDADTRFAIAWFEQNGTGEGQFGQAETLSKAKNVGINGLVEAGILASRAGKVRLLGREELDSAWDPAVDRRLTVWEVSQYLVKRLEDGGEGAAADLLRRVGGLGEVARELAYRLYTICERKGWPEEALGYNALVVSWPEIARLARERSGAPIQETLGV